MRRACALLALSVLLGPMPPASAGGPGTVTGTVAMGVMTVDLSLDRPSIAVGKKAGATAVILNLGDHDLTSVVATLQVASTLKIYPSASRSTAAIRPQRSWTVRWNVCSMTPGNYVLLASASGTYQLASYTAESTALLLTVAAGQRKGCP